MLLRLTAGGGPILLNTDHVILVEPLRDGGSTITLTGKENYMTVQESLDEVWQLSLEAQARFSDSGGMFEDVMTCVVCGCTDVAACEDEATGLPCHWVKPGLCSRCARINAVMEEAKE